MKKKQAIALLLATVLAGTGTVPYAFVSTVYAGQGNAPDAPTNLKTEMLNEAYGIDTKDPAFSWVVNDKDQKEVQTAYRIIISETSELKGEVLDTGWVESDENSYAHAEGLSDKLQDNELYYWQVQTKDKDGNESPLSEACPFMTFGQHRMQLRSQEKKRKIQVYGQTLHWNRRCPSKKVEHLQCLSE